MKQPDEHVELDRESGVTFLDHKVVEFAARLPEI